jgi:hypothetical protein
LNQQRLDEFILATCRPVYRSGSSRPLEPQREPEDEPRWLPRNPGYRSFMIRDGRLVEIGAFGLPRPPGRPKKK